MLAPDKSLWLQTVKKRTTKMTLTLQTVNITIKTDTTVCIVRITTVLTVRITTVPTVLNSTVPNSTVPRTGATPNVQTDQSSQIREPATSATNQTVARGSTQGTNERRLERKSLLNTINTLLTISAIILQSRQKLKTNLITLPFLLLL
jgi:hypothetical protein